MSESLVKVTSHVSPPYTSTYTLAEFIEANEELTHAEIASLVRGESIRLGGGAAPIVDVVPNLLAENERLRALLEKTLPEIGTVRIGDYEARKRLDAEIRAALVDGAK